MAQPKVRLVTYAWGRQHVEQLLNYALASTLAPGNLPALSKVFDCTVVVVTEEALFDDVRYSPTGRALQSICPLKLVPLDDLISEPWQYGMTLTYSLFRGFEDLGPAMTDTYILFLNADFVLADGSYERLIPRIQSDERVHLSPSYCTVEERVEQDLNKMRGDRGLSIPARELAAMILKNCHNTIRAKTVNQALLEFEHTDQFYWRIDQNTLIGRQLPISVIGMRPERHIVSMSTFWDWGVVYEFCPSKRLTVIADSDEFLMMELRPETKSLESIRLGHTSPKDIAKRTTGYVTQYQVDNARFKLLLHSGDLPPGLSATEQNLAQFVDTVLKSLPSDPIDHRNHSQWLYHKRHFRERLERKSFQSTRVRKGAASIAVPKVGFEQQLVDQKSVANRLLQVAHPYKNPRSVMQKLLHEFADRNPSVLVVCEHGSYLLRALDDIPGIQTHVTPESALAGILSTWSEGVPKFDVCLIEVSNCGAAIDIFDEAVPRLRERSGKILFLWNDRLNVRLRPAVSDIMKVITLRHLDFKLDFTLSWSSLLAGRILTFATKPRRARYGLEYLLKWVGLVTGGLSAILSRLLQPVSASKPSAYLTENCSSIAVELAVPLKVLRTTEQLGLSRVAGRRALTSREPYDLDLFFNGNPKFTHWIVKSGALHERFVVVDVGVFGGENPRWHFLKEHLVFHGFDAIKEAIEQLRVTNFDLKWDRTYHALAIGNENSDREFSFDPSQPTSSSFNAEVGIGMQRRLVPMRTLDSLLKDGTIPQADFLKVDVEGFERDVFMGARKLLSGGVLGVEVETNFRTSAVYPKSHFGLIHDLVLDHGLHLFDLNFDRSLRPFYVAARRGIELTGPINSRIWCSQHVQFIILPKLGRRA